MTLATHIVVGAAVARIFASHPAEAFVIGLATHYIMDSIQHWDYPIRAYASEKESPAKTKVHLNKYIFLDMGKVLLDILIGVAIVFAVVATSRGGLNGLIYKDLILLLIGAGAAILPDFIQFVYGVFKVPPLGTFQRFHHFMHAGKTLNDRMMIGIATQGVIIVLAGLLLSLTL